MRSTAHRIYQAALGICARLTIHETDIEAVQDVAWEAGARAAFGYVLDLEEFDSGVDAKVHELRRLHEEIVGLEQVMGR